MRKNTFRSGAHRRAESGQAMLFTLLGLGIFLIGAMAFAVDMSNLWFNRQSAQTAADAACTAGAMDLLVDATNSTTTQGGFTAGTAFDCKTKPTYAPCKYATFNGFGSSIASGSTALGNNVSVSFPASVPGVVTPPSGIAPTAFMKVTITDNIPTFFAGLLEGMKKQSVGAIAVCGVAQSAAPIPILVLDPQNPSNKTSALDVQGTPTISIFGGPSRSIQVNSNDTSAVTVGGNALIDLSNGGPSPGTGSDIGLFGGPTTSPGVPKNFNPGTTGHWIAPAAPIGDPFAQVCYPGQSTNCTTTINGYATPSVPPAPSGVTGSLGTVCTAANVLNGKCSVQYKENGCPDPTGCILYEPGAYAGGISVKNQTAIFDPGLYYVTGGFALQSNSTVRPGTGLGDGSGGTTFYFSGSGTVSVVANSGKSVLDPFNTLNGPVDSSGNPYAGAQAYTMGVKCTSTSAVPANLQGGGAGIPIQGNILLGPCTGYYGDPLGTSEPATIGEQRFFLFFQDRSATGVAPGWGGGGQFLLAGSMYFHSCNSTGAGTGCGSPSTYYTDTFSLQGNSGAGTYVLGEIVTDNLSLGGTSGINMDLNPTSAFNILKASLYQ